MPTLLIALLISQTTTQQADSGVTQCLSTTNLKNISETIVALSANSTQLLFIGSQIAGGELKATTHDFYLTTTTSERIQRLTEVAIHLLDLYTIANKSTDPWSTQYASQQFSKVKPHLSQLIENTLKTQRELPTTTRSLNGELQKSAQLMTKLSQNFANCGPDSETAKRSQ